MDLSKMKIKRVKFYQGVELSKTLVTYVAPDADKSSGVNLGTPKYTIGRTERGILVETETECVEIFNTNIAYITYEKTAEPVKAIKADELVKAVKAK